MSNEDFIRDLYACDEHLCLCKTPNPRVGFVYSHSQIYREQECQRLLTRSPATSKDNSPTMFSSPPEITCARTIICLEVNARLGWVGCICCLQVSGAVICWSARRLMAWRFRKKHPCFSLFWPVTRWFQTPFLFVLQVQLNSQHVYLPDCYFNLSPNSHPLRVGVANCTTLMPCASKILAGLWFELKQRDPMRKVLKGLEVCGGFWPAPNFPYCAWDNWSVSVSDLPAPPRRSDNVN